MPRPTDDELRALLDPAWQQHSPETVRRLVEELLDVRASDVSDTRQGGCMTLQPMDTAPRDGSEVLIVLARDYTGWSNSNRMLARWDASVDQWKEQEGIHYTTFACIGWVDIDALARDAEILDWLERKGLSTTHTGVVREMGVHSWNDVANACLKWTARNISSEFPSLRAAARAAIDKEMDRG